MSKDLIVKRMTDGQFFIGYEDAGGKVPDVLSGRYTKRGIAYAAITAYNAKKAEPKREYRKSRSIKNAKESTAECGS